MDRPVIFSGPMVRALLDGRKTMTRRLAWREPRDPSTGQIADSYQRPSQWQKAAPGDRLWVRERCVTITGPSYRGVRYIADGADDGDLKAAGENGPWDAKSRPSIHMPRWASRLTLVVTATKVERLQDISEEDAKAEGVELTGTSQDRTVWHASHRAAFCALWMHLHGIEAWDANPEVVAITFTVHKANIDRNTREGE